MGVDKQMNAVDLKTEIRSYLTNELSGLDGEMGEMIKMVALRKGGLLRPQIAIRSGEAYGEPRTHIMPAAAGTELVHAASLIFDDAPFMDNSNTRNGEASFHVKYGTDKAVLVALELTNSIAPKLNSTNLYLTPEMRTNIQSEFARAADGLCVGQFDDLHNAPHSLDEVIELHRKKTGDLFAAAAVIGGIAGSAPENEIEILRSFGHNLGIAYQMGDDVYDVFGNADKGGKPTGQDKDKVTLFDFMDSPKAIDFWRSCYSNAEADLRRLSSSLELRETQGNFTGIVNAMPLHDIISYVRDKQEGIMDLSAA